MKIQSVATFVISASLVLLTTWIGHAHLTDREETNLLPASPTLKLSLALSDPIIDPALIIDGPSGFIANQLFLGLVRVDENTGEPLPDLATSWVMSSDATVFTFTLRSDVTWIDGNPVTAFDARYGILRCLDPAIGCPTANMLFWINNAEEYNSGSISDPNQVGVTVLDYTHLRFTLKDSAAFFPYTLAFPQTRPLPFWAINSHPDDWTEPENIVTNGAYRLSVWEHGTSITLEKNLDYYDQENVQIEQVSLNLLGTDIAWEQYLSRQLDSVLVPAEQWDSAINDPNLEPQFHPASLLGTFYCGFNLDREPFDHPLVRKAFAATVNRQGIIEEILKYADLPALTFSPPGVWGHADGEIAGIGIPYNPNQARQWLAAAGYPNGQGLPPITFMFDTRSFHYDNNLAIANFLRQSWMDELNAIINIEQIEWADYLNLLETDPPQLWQIRWLANHTDAYGFLRESMAGEQHLKFGSWNNLAYEGLLDLAAATGDPDERATLYIQAEEILVESDAVMVPIHYFFNGIATQPYLQRSYGNGGYSGWISDWRMSWQIFLPFLTRND